MILLMGSNDDPQIHAIANQLQAWGEPYRVFDSSLFPAQHQLSYYPQQDNIALHLGDECFLPSDIHSLYWRNLQPSSTGLDNPIALRDSASLLRSFLHQLGNKAKNSAEAVRFHQEKPRQLARVAQCGIAIPATYVGNNPQAIREFCKKHPQSIFKPVTGGDYAQRIDGAHLTDEHLATSLRQSPVTLQAYIEGTNIRSYVFGEQIFSAEIRSTAQDFRTDDAAELIPIELPHEVSLQAKTILACLGLAWSGIDWRRTPTGDYIFLEANPSPMFVNFEQRTGFAITQYLAQLLIPAKN